MAYDSEGFAARPAAVGVPPEHYGNPLDEQRLLAAGEAIVDLSDRDVLSVTGPDRLTWIDSLTSQSITGLTPGDSSETLLLDPTGRIEGVMRLVDDGETLWILADAGAGASLLAFLQRMVFMLRVEPRDRTAEFATVGVIATDLPAELAAVVAAPAGVPVVWRDSWSAVTPGGVSYAAIEGHPGEAWNYAEVLVPRTAMAALAESGLPAAGTLALDALRIAAWRPRQATEVDATTIPHELDWLRSAVHLTKGCYRGQETVAKVHNLGHPPRRLVLLHLDGSEGVIPAPGDEVALAAEGAAVGRVTSVGRHYELGPIALAVVKRSADTGAPLAVVTEDGTRIAAAQEVIVPPSAGAAVQRPKLSRLGGSGSLV